MHALVQTQENGLELADKAGIAAGKAAILLLVSNIIGQFRGKEKERVWLKRRHLVGFGGQLHCKPASARQDRRETRTTGYLYWPSLASIHVFSLAFLRFSLYSR